MKKYFEPSCIAVGVCDYVNLSSQSAHVNHREENEKTVIVLSAALTIEQHNARMTKHRCISFLLISKLQSRKNFLFAIDFQFNYSGIGHITRSFFLSEIKQFIKLCIGGCLG